MDLLFCNIYIILHSANTQKRPHITAACWWRTHTLTDRNISLTKCWTTHTHTHMYLYFPAGYSCRFVLRCFFLLLLWMWMSVCVGLGVAWCFALGALCLSVVAICFRAGRFRHIGNLSLYIARLVCVFTCRILDTSSAVHIQRRVLRDTPERTDRAQCPLVRRWSSAVAPEWSWAVCCRTARPPAGAGRHWLPGCPLWRCIRGWPKRTIEMHC